MHVPAPCRGRVSPFSRISLSVLPVKFGWEELSPATGRQTELPESFDFDFFLFKSRAVKDSLSHLPLVVSPTPVSMIRQQFSQELMQNLLILLNPWQLLEGFFCCHQTKRASSRNCCGGFYQSVSEHRAVYLHPSALLCAVLTVPPGPNSAEFHCTSQVTKSCCPFASIQTHTMSQGCSVNNLQARLALAAWTVMEESKEENALSKADTTGE